MNAYQIALGIMCDYLCKFEHWWRELSFKVNTHQQNSWVTEEWMSTKLNMATFQAKECHRNLHEGSFVLLISFCYGSMRMAWVMEWISSKSSCRFLSEKTDGFHDKVLVRGASKAAMLAVLSFKFLGNCSFLYYIVESQMISTSV